ncbi:MAG TPA: aminotransferase [Hyphomicrobiales bacterium]|nr:aminotransferase [Hyphomicrobiales bacterium]
MNSVFASLPTTIFEVMSGLARETGAINLGQGFPDDPGPADIRRAAANEVENGYNQYPPMLGTAELRQAVAQHYKAHQGVDLDWSREVFVTSGATEALAACILGLVEPGDEVVLIQPMYDAYLPMVRRAGGVARFVTLQPPEWRLTEDALARAFTPNTRLVLVNNPLNPTGTVFSRDDLALLARFAAKSGAIVVADEVWEHIVFDGRRHVSVLTLPELRGRAVKIGSAGKMFGLTGWKVGFVCAAPELMTTLAKAHQFLTFTTPPNLQAAVAYGLGKDPAWFAAMRADLQASRDRLSNGLVAAGYRPLTTAGTYFLAMDLSPLGVGDDVAFARRLVTEAGIATIPVSAFYAEDHVRSVVRFCFAKTDAVLDEALSRLAGFAAKLAA